MKPQTRKEMYKSIQRKLFKAKKPHLFCSENPKFIEKNIWILNFTYCAANTTTYNTIESVLLN